MWQNTCCMCFMKCLGMVVHPTNRLGGLGYHPSYLRGHCPHLSHENNQGLGIEVYTKKPESYDSYIPLTPTSLEWCEMGDLSESIPQAVYLTMTYRVTWDITPDKYNNNNDNNNNDNDNNNNNKNNI